MKIDKICVYKVLLPFSGEFSHSLRKRVFTNNIVVEVIADGGTISGYGEGAPRRYVTGETQENAVKKLKYFIENSLFPWELNNTYQIWEFLDILSDGKDDNSAICALEMSLLDILGRKQNRYITEYFPKTFFTDTIYYGGGVPLSNPSRKNEICRLIKKMNIKRVKLKMSKDIRENQETFEIAKQHFGDDYDLKVDVNGAWDYETALKHIPMLIKYKVRAVEQPMAPDDSNIEGFARSIKENGIILMADESACCLEEVKRLIKEDHYNMINVRISKCGGFRRSLRIIDYLRDNNISFQIGCQLGETGLLSAAGRALSLLCGDAIYYDGSYDEFMLKENITSENVSFGAGGKAGPLKGFGLGIEVSRQKLERLSDLPEKITIIRPN